MLMFEYIEDLYIEFYKEMLGQVVLTKESDTLSNFYILCLDDRAFTEKQARYIVTLMKKYQTPHWDTLFNYSQLIDAPKFKKSFRTIDHSKRVYIEKLPEGKVVICFKFPYAFKQVFDKEILEHVDGKNTGGYDPAWQARKINFFDVNPISIYEFAVAHNFEIDETVLHAVSETETAWDNSEALTPVGTVTASTVTLVTGNSVSQEFFKQHGQETVEKNQFLAKSMGYPVKLNQPAATVLEKIVSDRSNTFWLQESSQLLELYKLLECKICVILDRTDDKVPWIKHFVAEADALNIDKSKIKICFRESKDQGQQFNAWVKDSGHGGKMDAGDIYIFDHKPAKWLFKNTNFVKIVVTTSKFPPTASLTKDWIDSHPCAIYLSDIKPTVKGNKKLVKL